MTVAASTQSDSQTPAAPSAPSPKGALSPAMRQYQQFKEQYPGYVLFFRMGDFYEMFWEDAQLAARTLGVTLTSRGRGRTGADDAIPMAGVPFHAVDGYLRKMIAAGHRVAICEQTEDASQAKGVIQREVVRLMTPGTLTDDPLLDGSADNYLASVGVGITKADGYRTGLCWVELSTGACVAASGVEDQILDELVRLRRLRCWCPSCPRASRTILPKNWSSGGFGLSRPGPAGSSRRTTPASSCSGNGRRVPQRVSASPTMTRPCSLRPPLLPICRKRRNPRSAHIPSVAPALLEAHLSIDPASCAAWKSIARFAAAPTKAPSSNQSTALSLQWDRACCGSAPHAAARVEHIVARQSAVSSFSRIPRHSSGAGCSSKDVCDVERIIGRVCARCWPPPAIWLP